jgi:hypothetical protein
MSSIVSVKCIQNYRLHVMTWPGSRKPKMSSRVRVAQTHKCCVLPMVPKNSQVSRRFVSPWIGFVNTYIEDCWKFWKTQKKIVRSLNCGEGALLYGRELFILYRFNHSLEPLGVLNDNDGDNRKTHIQSQNIDTTIEKKNCQVGVTSWHRWIADDSRVSKMPLILLKIQLFIGKLKKRGMFRLSVVNSNFSEWICLSCWIFSKSIKSKIHSSRNLWLSLLQMHGDMGDLWF